MDNESIMEVDNCGNKQWRKNMGLHRLNGPAIEYANGSKEWWQNDRLHRLDGPAIEYIDGLKEWWKNGILHREDGPAIIFADGEIKWYLNDFYYETKEEYFDALSYEAKERALFSQDFLNG